MGALSKDPVFLLEEFKNYIPYFPLIADLIASDLYLYQPAPDLCAGVLVAEARPRVVPPLSIRQEIGKIVFENDDPGLMEVLYKGKKHYKNTGVIIGGFPAEEEIFPLKKGNKIIGALKILRNLLIHNEFPYNAKAFKESSYWLIKALLKGELNWKGFIESVEEQESILILDKDGIILFANLPGMRLFRSLGEIGNIWGKKIKDEFFYRFLNNKEKNLSAFGEEIYEEIEDEKRIFYKRILPLSKDKENPWRYYFLIREITEIKERERELRFKSVLLKEIHHRVKNNLQTIASLLRIQMRRIDSESAKMILQESINRINSIALVHESLSRFEEDRVDIIEVAGKLINAFKQTYEQFPYEFNLKKGRKKLFLPSKEATSASLIINELLQNAVKHGIKNEDKIDINLSIDMDRYNIIFEVSNNGSDSSFETNISKGSLGLQLVQMLVEEELKGKLEIFAKENEFRVRVTFPKSEGQKYV
ncbi:MAG: sensor histidine kinase [Dictyoglomus sp.]|nr:sensor histidine kinase [Dictyoglomus sp.]MDW8189062.1 histidine kinase N-terminal domain-containing protein [Dictyoglomus sp.]